MKENDGKTERRIVRQILLVIEVCPSQSLPEVEQSENSKFTLVSVQVFDVDLILGYLPMFYIDGTFKKNLDGGLHNSYNPQIEIITTDEGSVEMTLKPRWPSAKRGSLIIRTIHPLDIHERTRFPKGRADKKDKNIGYRGPVYSPEMKYTQKIPKGRHIILLQRSFVAGQGDTDFTLEVKRTEFIESIKMIPDYDRLEVKSDFFSLNGGIGELSKNPQFLLHTTGPSEPIDISILLNDSEKTNPLYIAIAKPPPHEGRRRRVFEETDIIANSNYNARSKMTDELVLHLTIDPSKGPYLIIPCSRMKLRFTLKVETDGKGRGKLAKLEEIKDETEDFRFDVSSLTPEEKKNLAEFVTSVRNIVPFAFEENNFFETSPIRVTRRIETFITKTSEYYRSIDSSFEFTRPFLSVLESEFRLQVGERENPKFEFLEYVEDYRGLYRILNAFIKETSIMEEEIEGEEEEFEVDGEGVESPVQAGSVTIHEIMEMTEEEMEIELT